MDIKRGEPTRQGLIFLIAAILIFTGIGLGVSNLKKETRPVEKLYTEGETIPVVLEREISAKSEDNIVSAVKKVSLRLRKG